MQNVKDEYHLTDTLEMQTGLSLIKFSSGHTLAVDNITSEIKLLDKNQTLQLVISFNDERLTVNVNASELNISAAEELNLTSKKINIEASEHINIKSKGNLVQQTGKDCLTETAGTNKNIAKIQKLTANLGNVEIKANDDVKLDGESVKLNSDE
jgi:uncharacterized protein (DUF2345 family)